MKLRIAFGVALIAVLFAFWLFSQRPLCREGFTASFGVRDGWSCVEIGN